MNILEIIEKKKHGKELSTEEIKFVIEGYVNEEIKDYQMSSLLMAILLKGMTDRETGDLTLAMLHSGDVIDLTSIDGVKVDKHSTGGVGDKTTMVLSPMVAACGAKVAKMSGRGLGHTGGTADKLESIPGYQVSVKQEDFIDQVNKIGIALISQTGNLVPADKKIYALRDVTATVDSIPLIASSIMSKKLASGADTILLDVKCGEGAFMQTVEDAEKLAKAMIAIGKHAGKDTRVIITDMNQPLGNTIGNSLEVLESIETLKGEGPEDLTELCVESGAIMLLQAGIETDHDKAVERLRGTLKDGSALEKFRECIAAQGGDSKVVDDTSLLPKAKHVTPFKLNSGYIKEINALELGILSSDLGAGRKTKEDSINFAVGLDLNYKEGDFVPEGEPLLYIHHDEELSEDWLKRLEAAYEIVDHEVEKPTLIYERL